MEDLAYGASDVARALRRMSGLRKRDRLTPAVVPDPVGGLPHATASRLMVIERDKFKLSLYALSGEQDYKLLMLFPIAVGAKGYRTPRGLFRITSKVRDPDWYMPREDWIPEEQWGTVVPGGDPRNPLKKRWLGVTPPEDGIGIHGTDDDESIGSAASHGCIRLHAQDVIDLYPNVPIGTPTYIV